MGVSSIVSMRLAALGYTPVESDAAMLQYNIAKAELTLKHDTNRPEVPEGLLYVWADMAAGMFLKDKKASGGLAGTYDFSAPAKSISEGDTSVSFALADSGSFEQQFDTMLDEMIHPEDELVAAFRRLAW